MAIVFDITYECSLLAQSGKLYYRYTRGSGSTSAWIYNTTLGVFPIDTSTCVGTPCIQTLPNVQGVSPDFLPNTAYEFKIEQTCSDGTVVESPASQDIYVEACNPFSLVVDLYPQSANDMTINIYDLSGPGNPLNPLGVGITKYYFDIYWLNPNLPNGPASYELLGTIELEQGDILAYLAPGSNPGATVYPLLVQGGSAPLINQSNGQAPFQQNEDYVIMSNIEIATPSGPVYYNCPRETPITFPDCKQYRIYTGTNWVVRYKDCQTQTDRWIRGSTPVSPFYICSVYPPIAGRCTPTGTIGSSVIQPPSGSPIVYPPGSTVAPVFTGTVTIGVAVETNLTLLSGCDTLFDSPFPDYITNQGVTNFLVGPC
jgi:hypothetical protein